MEKVYNKENAGHLTLEQCVMWHKEDNSSRSIMEELRKEKERVISNGEGYGMSEEELGDNYKNDCYK